MNRAQMVTRVRNLTRDLTNTIFRQEDILEFINEAIDRCGQIIPQLSDMVYLESDSDVPTHLPRAYHSLISIYATGRCFGQDERHYQATTFMNEFEQKMDELKVNVENGRVLIKDVNGNVVDSMLENDFVVDDYYTKDSSYDPFDLPDTDWQEGTVQDDTPETPDLDGGEW
jgi:hypothetical protein